MGLFDKMAFWKKDDAPEQPPSYDLGAQRYDPLQQSDPLHQDPMGSSGQSMNQNDPFAPEQSHFQQPFQQTQSYPTQTAFPGRQMTQSASQPQQVPEQYQEHDAGIHPRDVELILAKLDSIKSELDALHQRVRKIEQVSDNAGNKKYW